MDFFCIKVSRCLEEKKKKKKKKKKRKKEKGSQLVRDHWEYGG